MTIVNLLDPGLAYALTQNQIYALPQSTGYLIATNVIELSNTTVTTAFVAYATSTTGMQYASQFVRCTSVTTCVISIKKF